MCWRTYKLLPIPCLPFAWRDRSGCWRIFKPVVKQPLCWWHSRFCNTFGAKLKISILRLSMVKSRYKTFLRKLGTLFFLLLLTCLLAMQRSGVQFLNNKRSRNIITIASELSALPERHCLIWISTQDKALRTSSYPCQHQYVLDFQCSCKNVHLLLCILLPGDIATNPGPESTTTGLEILYLNARSLKAFVHVDGHDVPKLPKISLLQEIVYSGGYDVICMCETWLNSAILDNELLVGYSIHRQDRKGKKWWWSFSCR